MVKLSEECLKEQAIFVKQKINTLPENEQKNTWAQILDFSDRNTREKFLTPELEGQFALAAAEYETTKRLLSEETQEEISQANGFLEYITKLTSPKKNSFGKRPQLSMAHVSASSENNETKSISSDSEEYQKLGYLEKVKIWEKRFAEGNIKMGNLTPENVVRLELIQGFKTNLDIAKRNAKVMRRDMAEYEKDPSKSVQALGCLTGHSARQAVIAAKKEKGSTKGVYLYLSGWQVAGARNSFGPMPDQSMQEKTSVPQLIEEIYAHLRGQDSKEYVDLFNALDEARKANNKAKEQQILNNIDNFQTNCVPMVCDIDAGYGNADATGRLAEKMIRAGAPCVQIENQKSDVKQCGHQDAKVTKPREDFIACQTATRAAFTSLGVDGLIIARTDSLGAGLTAKIPVLQKAEDHADKYNKHLAGVKRPPQHGDLIYVERDGSFKILDRLQNSLSKFKPGTGEQRVVEDCKANLKDGCADLLWIETGKGDAEEIERIISKVREEYPNAKIVYNNSPSFNWTLNMRKEVYKEWKRDKKDLSQYPDPAKYPNALMHKNIDKTPLGQAALNRIRDFQGRVSKAGVFINLITLPEYHANALIMERLARGFYGKEAMAAYVEQIQLPEIREGISTVRHQDHALTKVADFRKKMFEGSQALSAMGKNNTMSQFSLDEAQSDPVFRMKKIISNL